MVIKTASPGIYLQEVDLTRGVVDPVSSNVAVCAGPFQRGPVDQLIRITTEVELREVFGKPTDENHEYWWTINNFLEYSGQCYVVRCDDAVGDVIDDSIPDGLGEHLQSMRNATDSFVFGLKPQSFSAIDQAQASSPLYIKNEDQFAASVGEIVPNGGKFFGRNPGEWTNGIGIAVIDSGADFRLRIASSYDPISTDYLLVINGGTSGEAGADGDLFGGTSGSAYTDPINFDESNIERRNFDPETIVGTKLVQYAKVSLQELINFSEVGAVDVESPGSGIVCPPGFDCETDADGNLIILDVPTVAESGDGQDLRVDLEVAGESVIRARLSFKGATKPTGFKEGDIVRTQLGATEEALIRVTEVRDLPGTVIRIGDSEDGIIGVVIREENGVLLVANAAHTDGSFGTAAKGDNVSDPQIGGSSLGLIEEYAVMGHYLFYGKDGERAIDVVWEPQEYTREEGMEWLWPNRPFGGETVFASKVAKNANGVPIQAEGSTATNPIYETLEGPATMTSSTGNTIVWNAVKERWVQNYTPQQGDILFDSYVNPTDSSIVVYPFPVLDAYDWYSQQVALEGVPWIQFGPRPRTSAHAQEMGCTNDELNIIVYDALGDYETIGGEAPRKGRILEQYIQVSKLKDALTVEGSNNYYRDLINRDSEILFSNEPLDIIDSNEEINPDLNLNTLNDGRALPNTKISFGLDCAYIQPRYGSPDYQNPNAMSTRVSTSGVSKLKIISEGAGFGASMNREFIETTTNGKGTGLKVNITTDLAGSVTAVAPSVGYDFNAAVSYYGTNYQYGDLITINNGAGQTATFEVVNLSGGSKSPYLLLGGTDQLTASLGELQAAYRKVIEENVADLDYILQGPAYDRQLAAEQGLNDTMENSSDYQYKLSFAVAKANFLIALADERMDCMALVSPPKHASVDPIDSNQITENIVDWANRISSSSYGVMDSGYKYMYDRFRDKFQFVPLNGDIAGCMARTSLVSQPFFSPAGMSRGQIKNVVKLGYDASKANRDLLYTSRVNPVCTFPGEGTILYGDKTCLAYSSAFTRINVRKLFIYVERAIARLSRSVLFEFNDTPTRLNFVNTVNPFLTDVVSKRGATDFLVVCDTSNNTPDVIDRNEFVADIYIKPNRSINFVQLTFVATKTGVSFGEAVAINRRAAN